MDKDGNGYLLSAVCINGLILYMEVDARGVWEVKIDPRIQLWL
jgi:hypothetical protein